MATNKKSKKPKQHLAVRAIKIIFITLACAILIAAIVQRIRHYRWHITK